MCIPVFMLPVSSCVVCHYLLVTCLLLPVYLSTCCLVPMNPCAPFPDLPEPSLTTFLSYLYYFVYAVSSMHFLPTDRLKNLSSSPWRVYLCLCLPAYFSSLYLSSLCTPFPLCSCCPTPLDILMGHSLWLPPVCAFACVRLSLFPGRAFSCLSSLLYLSPAVCLSFCAAVVLPFPSCLCPVRLPILAIVSPPSVSVAECT